MDLVTPKILIVDDEPLVLEMFEAMLRDSGYQTTTASSAAQAQKCLTRESFDLIIVDVWLEDDDGFVLAQYAAKVQPKLGVIVITGRPSDRDKEVALASGFDYLSKPVPYEQLRSSVSSKLQIANLSQQGKFGQIQKFSSSCLIAALLLS